MLISTGVELVEFRELADGNLQVQLAIDGVLAPAIDDHKSHMEEFKSEQDYFLRMAQDSRLLIHLYGDARYPLPPERVAENSEKGF